MTLHKPSSLHVLGLLVPVLISGCGGGGSGSGGSNTPVTSASAASGAITGFGSFFVNGVEYFLSSSAQLRRDDSPATESEFHIGDIVEIRGSIDDNGITGTATSVSFNDNLEGPVSNVDTANNRLLVLGQTVLVDALTVFDNVSSLAALSVGNIVEVSGLTDANGIIHASRIDLKAGSFAGLGTGAIIEVKGRVSGLNTLTNSFSLGALNVDFSNAVLTNLPAGTLANGQLIEVKSTTAPVGGTLTATQIEGKTSGLSLSSSTKLEVEGYIDSFVSATQFTVNGQAVTTTASTFFENGSAADLGNNVKVEAEGRVDANGTLVAKKVSLRRGNLIRIEALVDGVDSSTGLVTVLGLPVKVDSHTRMTDNSSLRDKLFNFGKLASGNFVEIRASKDAAGNLVAAKLRRDDGGSQTVLQAPLQNADALLGTVELLGITVMTTASTQYRDTGDNSISKSAFFASLVNGVTLVKAKGNVSGSNLLTAQQLELEIEN